MLFDTQILLITLEYTYHNNGISTILYTSLPLRSPVVAQMVTRYQKVLGLIPSRVPVFSLFLLALSCLYNYHALWNNLPNIYELLTYNLLAIP